MLISVEAQIATNSVDSIQVVSKYPGDRFPADHLNSALNPWDTVLGT